MSYIETLWEKKSRRARYLFEKHFESDHLWPIERYLHKAESDQPHEDEHEPRPKHPSLVIPYYPSDIGDRSIDLSTYGAIYYLCPSIKINGDIFNGVPLLPNVPVKLTVDVTNSGQQGATVTLRMFWVDPSTGITPSPLIKISDYPVKFYIPALTTKSSPELMWVPKNDMPEHICLVAVAESSKSMADGSWNPSVDPHYAQYNILIKHMQPGQNLSFSFFVSNPFPNASLVTVRARELSEQQLQQLEKIYLTQAIPIPLDAFRFQTQDNNEFQHELNLELSSRERRLCQLLMRPVFELEENKFMAVGIEQTLELRTEEPTESKITSGLGLVIFGHIP